MAVLLPSDVLSQQRHHLHFARWHLLFPTAAVAWERSLQGTVPDSSRCSSLTAADQRTVARIFDICRPRRARL